MHTYLHRPSSEFNLLQHRRSSEFSVAATSAEFRVQPTIRALETARAQTLPSALGQTRQFQKSQQSDVVCLKSFGHYYSVDGRHAHCRIFTWLGWFNLSSHPLTTKHRPGQLCRKYRYVNMEYGSERSLSTRAMMSESCLSSSYSTSRTASTPLPAAALLLSSPTGLMMSGGEASLRGTSRDLLHRWPFRR